MQRDRNSAEQLKRCLTNDNRDAGHLWRCMALASRPYGHTSHHDAAHLALDAHRIARHQEGQVQQVLHGRACRCGALGRAAVSVKEASL